MSERNSSQITRRDVLKGVTGAVVAGAAGLGITQAAGQQSRAAEPVEVIYMKTRSLDDPGCFYPGFEPGVRVEDGIRIERDVAVKMRDGVTIYTDIYRPNDAANIPALIAWSPYGKQAVEHVP